MKGRRSTSCAPPCEGKMPAGITSGNTKSTSENPRWFMVDIKGEHSFATPVTRDEIKANPKLKDMLLIRKGMRLSIQPVTKEEFDEVVSMGGGSKSSS